MHVIDGDARWTGAATAAILLSGSLLLPTSLHATSINASASATVVAPARVSEDAHSHLQSCKKVGVLTLVIPGCNRENSGCTLKLTAICSLVNGRVSVFSAAGGGANLSRLSRALVSAGGTLSTSGSLSGNDVQIVVLKASPGSARGQVSAIVTYN